MRTLLLLALAGCTAQAAPPVAGGGGAAGGDGSDTTAIHDDVAGEINAIGAITPAAGDKLVAEDANDSWAKGSITIQGIVDLVPAGTDYSTPCHSGTLPVAADWTVDTAGTVTVTDTAKGISMLTTTASTTMLLTRAFSATSAAFGIWQQPTTKAQNVGMFIGLADADGTTGAGVWLRTGAWETLSAINLTANTVTPSGTAFGVTMAPAYWRARVISATKVRIESGDNCGQWGAIYNDITVADTTLLDVAVVGVRSGGSYFGYETETMRLFDYETE